MSIQYTNFFYRVDARNRPPCCGTARCVHFVLKVDCRWLSGTAICGAMAVWVMRALLVTTWCHEPWSTGQGSWQEVCNFEPEISTDEIITQKQPATKTLSRWVEIVGSEPLKQLWICQVSGVAGHLCHLSLGAGRGFWRVAEIKKDMVGRMETDLFKLVGPFWTNMKVMIWYEGKYGSNRILV